MPRGSGSKKINTSMSGFIKLNKQIKNAAEKRANTAEKKVNKQTGQKK